MSEYFRAVCPMAKSRYLEKLSLLGSDDPYATSNVDKFVTLTFCSVLNRPPRPPNGRGTSVSCVYLPFNIPSHLAVGNSYNTNCPTVLVTRVHEQV